MVGLRTPIFELNNWQWPLVLCRLTFGGAAREFSIKFECLQLRGRSALGADLSQCVSSKKVETWENFEI